MWTCPKCKSENASDISKYCGNCGETHTISGNTAINQQISRGYKPRRDVDMYIESNPTALLLNKISRIVLIVGAVIGIVLLIIMIIALIECYHPQITWQSSILLVRLAIIVAIIFILTIFASFMLLALILKAQTEIVQNTEDLTRLARYAIDVDNDEFYTQAPKTK